MATKEFIVTKGGDIPPFLASLFTEIYGESKVAELSAGGVRVRVDVNSPWPKEKKRPKPNVDETTLPRLRQLVDHPESLEQEIEQFSATQLMRIAEMAGVHLSKGAKVTSLRAQLLNSLRSESVWRGISGGPDESERASNE